MIRKISALVGLALCLGLLSAAPANADRLPPLMLGPGDADVNGIGHEAVVRYSKFGPVYITGKHSHHLRVTHVEKHNSIRFRDTRTLRIKGGLPDRCHKEQVKKGISVVCKIPPRFAEKRMFIQVWPRLGNDYTDGRTLPKRFRLWVLTDAGQDVVYGGAGADFVNGAKGNDRAYGGGGKDWLRGGPGADRITGGPGKDRISHG